ncbi:MAG: exodeoxyribonuclease VII large subunit [Bacilli bacterium]|nr:exodeoxyribonuclease VII large subunit [Bacilli bacterium]
MNDKYLTVSAINRYIKYKIDTDEGLQTVFIKGEISNFKAHSTGHLYFSIKDDTSKINAIMFSTNAKKLNFKPVDGTKVLIAGRVSVYEANGNYQVYVNEMIEDGVGNLYIAFEKLKNQLASEGLFDEKYKKQIPKYPEKIGVITANTGAAIKDILSTIKRRYPIAQVILFPSLVQGDNAKEDIVKNIKLANNYDLDVLIVGRGGGSIEDLWPFNEEIVARAIFESNIPIISAVGHEVDYTIADFVADLRAPTPTGAAEMAVPNLVDLIKHIEQLKIRLNESVLKQYNINKIYLDSLKNSYIIKNPLILYENKKQRLDLLNEKLNNTIYTKLENNKNKLENMIDKLNLVNPLNILKRGFTLTYKNGKIAKQVSQINKNDELTIKLYDGNIKVNVKEVEHEI